MNMLMGFEFSTAIFNTSTSITVFPFNETLLPVAAFLTTPFSSASYLAASKCSSYFQPGTRRRAILSQATLASSTESSTQANSTSAAQVEERSEAEVAEGYTMSQFCDKMIDFFLNEKTKTKEWRRYLVFREEWNKYKDRFYDRCERRAEMESDPTTRDKFLSLRRKMKKIDDEMQGHSELFKEVQDNATDINIVVARRRRDFTGEFFRYLSLLSDTYDSLEDRDAVSRLGARCLSAVSAYDNTLEIVDTLDTAQAKFDDILNSPSIEVACDKIKSLAKAKQLDSSLVLLINGAWAKAKDSTTMTNEVLICPLLVGTTDNDSSNKLKILVNLTMHKVNLQSVQILTCHGLPCDLSDTVTQTTEWTVLGTMFCPSAFGIYIFMEPTLDSFYVHVLSLLSTQSYLQVKDIMYRIYKSTKSCLRSIAPKEIKLLKHLLNIIDPEERFSALATAFSPGDDREERDSTLYTTPEELHKWVKIMLDAYHLNKEETDMREAKRMPPPIVIERLYVLKETIEEEYLARRTPQKSQSENDSTTDVLGVDI